MQRARRSSPLHLDRGRPSPFHRELDRPRSYRLRPRVLSVSGKSPCDSPMDTRARRKDDTDRRGLGTAWIHRPKSMPERRLPDVQTRRSRIALFQTALSFFQLYLFQQREKARVRIANSFDFRAVETEEYGT